MSDPIVTNESHHEDHPPKKRWARIGLFFCLFGLIILVAAFGYGYRMLANINVDLAQQVSKQQQEIVGTQKNLSTLQNDFDKLQQSSEKNAELSAKQEKIIAEWEAAQKGSLTKWHAAQAQYLVRIANDELQITHNVSVALASLQRAEEVLKSANDATLTAIANALAANITQLQATSTIDVNSLYARINGLSELIPQLPFPALPVDANTTTVANSDNNLSWWRAGLKRTEDALRKIVVIRYDDSRALPLVLPDEKLYLQQNLQTQLETAMWAVLNRNADVYQASLARASSWVKKYFDQEASVTKNMLQELQNLQTVQLTVPALNLASTLQSLDDYTKQKTEEKKLTPVSENKARE